MKHNKLLQIVGLIAVVSMVMAACQSTPTTAPTTAPAQEEAPATEAAPAEEPTEAEVAPTEEAAEPTEAVSTTNRKGGWLDEIDFSAVADAEPAVAQIQAGTIDMYSATIDKAEVYETVKNDATLASANVYGSSNQMLLNTAACQDATILNPFSDQKIREAMNWAVDRDYIVQEIFGGLAKAKFNPFTTAFPDYARYADLFGAIETKYAYDLDKAKSIVDEEMPVIGAEKGSDGVWTFAGEPVTVIVLIRTEDKRLEIGNYFANQLEELGFKVDRQEKNRTDAATIWQADDPTLCTFNAYTAGWISPQIYRDEGLNFNQYNTGEMQGLPVMNAYQPSKTLLDLGHDLYNNNFTTMDERKEMFAEALDLSMQESWWGVWINDSISFEAYSNQVEGASDLAGGFAGSQLFPYTARFVGQEGGTMKIANSAVLVTAWNPIAGSNWIDDTIVRNTTVDYGAVYNPYTGLMMNKLIDHADLVALDGLPIAEPQSDWMTLESAAAIDVPDDAWVDWDATNQVFITAAEKKAADPTWTATAKTKLTVTYIPELWDTTWHDGSKMTVADFVYNMIMAFDPGKSDSAIYDESLESSLATYLQHFKGIKIVSTDPLTIETYDDIYALDAENNVFGRDWYPNLYVTTSLAAGMGAWHNMTPGVQAEADGKMAFGQDKSTTKEIDYTSQISGPTLDVQMAYVDQDIADSYIPYAATMSNYITADEAVERYNNLKAFYAEHGHIVLGTGPYFIDKVYPVEGSIVVKHYDGYLFPSDQFAKFSEAELMTLSVEGPTTIAAGDEASFDIYLDFKDAPYPSADVDSLSYTLFDASGNSVASGAVDFVDEGLYSVTLGSDVTSQLTAGTAKLSVAAASKVVSLPVFETAQFVVTE